MGSIIYQTLLGTQTNATAVATNTNIGIVFGTPYSSGNLIRFPYKVEKRIAATPVTYATNLTTGNTVTLVNNATPVSITGYQSPGTKGVAYMQNSNFATGSFYFWQYTVSADF